MKSSIGTVALCFAVTVLLFASDGFARDPSSVSLCPPSLRMTEHDGCQPSNSLRAGTLPIPTKDDAEQWKQIVLLIHSTSLEVQSCVWRGPLRSGWTVDGARAEISRCQRAVEVSDRIKSIPSPEIQSCVWTGPLRNNLTLETAEAEISRCQDVLREREREHQQTVDTATAELLSEWIICIVTGIVLFALTIRSRAKIAAYVYNLFIGCLSLRLRFNRFRKRFLDNDATEFDVSMQMFRDWLSKEYQHY